MIPYLFREEKLVLKLLEIHQFMFFGEFQVKKNST